MNRSLKCLASSACSAALLTAIALPAGAQQSMSPQSPGARTRAFITQAAQTNLAEISEGRLAERQATSKNVRYLGKRYADNHRANQRKLTTIAQRLGIRLPDRPTPEQRAEYMRLSGLHGAAFDRAFLQAEQRDHMRAIEAFQREIRTGNDPAVLAYARQTLPVLDEHLLIATDDADKQRTAHRQMGQTDGMSGMNGMQGMSGTHDTNGANATNGTGTSTSTSTGTTTPGTMGPGTTH